MSGESADDANTLPPLCYIRHVTTGETMLIRPRVEGWEPAETNCSPECLNAKLPRIPLEAEIAAMRHGSLLGWDGPGATAGFWRARQERR